MKKFITVTLSILFSVVLFAQHNIQKNLNQHLKDNRHQYEKILNHGDELINSHNFDYFDIDIPFANRTKEAIWVNDSIYYYDGDSTDWLLEYRYKELTRDEYGNMTSAIDHFYDETKGEWTNKYFHTVTCHNDSTINEYLRQAWNSNTEEWLNQFYNKYDENGNVLGWYEKYWDFNTNEFFDGRKGAYVFNSNGNMIHRLHQDWVININDWVNDSQTLFTYDTNGNNIHCLIQDWDSYGNDWMNDCQIFYTYNVNGYETIQLVQDWDGIVYNWVNDIQFLWTYDINGNWINYLGQEWDISANVWINDWNNIFSYNANGNMTNELSQFWDSSINDWINGSQYFYTYDVNGNISNKLSQLWDSFINEWVNSQQLLYTYDANGNMTYFLAQMWDNYTNNWVNGSQSFYNYDENGNITLYIWQYWDMYTGNLLNERKVEYYWSEFEIGGISEFIPTVISVYPNPSSGIFNIILDEPLKNATYLKIFNIEGKLISSQKISGNNIHIDMSNKTKGVYFIKIYKQKGFKIIVIF